MPASALGHGAFPFWDASFVHQYWASAELYQAQLCRDFFSFFFFYLFFLVYVLVCFFKNKDDLAVISGPVLWLYGLVALLAMLPEQGPASSPFDLCCFRRGSPLPGSLVSAGR